MNKCKCGKKISFYSRRCSKCDDLDRKNRIKGKNNPFYGKHHTEKTKNKIRKKNSGKNHPRYIDGKSNTDLYRFKIHIKNLYNITLKQYNNLLKKQNNKCAVCGIEQKNLKCRLSIDHDYKTGKVRGLLCRLCNAMLGRIEKNDKLVIILKYLNYEN